MSSKEMTLSKPQDAISPKRRAAFERALAKGFTAEEIALHIVGKRNRNFRRIRGQVRRVMAEAEEFQRDMGLRGRGVMVEGLEGAAEALVRRAHRGRPDAIKLLFEATGFHNPRVQHEHSGEIEIKMTAIPRPPAVDEDGVVDAEVVEED